jgi:NAD(P)-dependent dehydrogenase (short-subunit alcohol dehydrogenase family)
MYLNKLKLDGRVAIVTGGGRAIGLACVHASAEAQAKVVIADIDPEMASSGQAELRKAGYRLPVAGLIDDKITRSWSLHASSGNFRSCWSKPLHKG